MAVNRYPQFFSYLPCNQICLVKTPLPQPSPGKWYGNDCLNPATPDPTAINTRQFSAVIPSIFPAVMIFKPVQGVSHCALVDPQSLSLNILPVPPAAVVAVFFPFILQRLAAFLTHRLFHILLSVQALTAYLFRRKKYGMKQYSITKWASWRK